MARIFKYKVDVGTLKLDAKNQEIFESNEQKTVFEDIMHQGLNSLYPQGFGGAKQRTFHRILNALDNAKEGVFTLEESEFDMLKEIFESENSKFPSVNTRLVMAYRLAISNADKVELSEVNK